MLAFPELQSEVRVVVPLWDPALLITQLDEVWRVIESVLWALTPSMMSISPLLGQLGPKSQKAGHVPHIPPGVWEMSAMKRPCVYSLLLCRRIEFRPLLGHAVVWSTPT